MPPARTAGAAHALTAEKGFEGLRVREVAARVGVNNATLHYYFPTKEALIGAVVDAIARELGRVPGGSPAAPSPRALSTCCACYSHQGLL